MKELINQCILQFDTVSKENNITLKANLPDTISAIKGDHNCLKRTFINLIMNAIENIPRGSVVEVSAQEYDDKIDISIKDNGPGISEDIASKLFDRYYAGKSTERKVGSGLGLYISKKFVEAHGGNITVDTVINKYSNFIVSIPIKRGEK